MALASPPGVFPGAELLVLPGIALLVEAALEKERPLLGLWLGGLVFFAWVSWSLGYVPVPLKPHYLMGPVGGLVFMALGLYWRLWERRLGRASLPLAVGMSWAVYEWLRSVWPAFPYPHAQASHAFYEWRFLLGPVRIVGEPGMNFLVASLPASLWLLFRSSERSPGKEARTWLSVGLVVVAWALLSIPPGPMRPLGSPIRVALVQTGLKAYPDQENYYKELDRDSILRLFRKLAAESGNPELIVWPESVWFWQVQEDDRPTDLELAAQYLGTKGSALLFGSGLHEPATESGFRHHRNVSFLLSAQGKELGTSEKRYLVPCGEEVPVLSLVLSEASYRRLIEAIAEWTGGWGMLLPGRKMPPPQLPDGRRIGVAICFENCFPSLFAQLSDEGASAFFVLSNENWYREGAVLDQMLAASVFRALETGRPILRATTDGFTVHLDGEGRVVDVLGVGPAGVLQTRVQPVAGSRPALRWELWLPWILSALMAGAVLFRKRAGSSTLDVASG